MLLAHLSQMARQRQQQPHNYFGGAPSGQRPPNPYAMGPGGANTMPSAQAAHGFGQGPMGATAPMKGGIQSLLNAIGRFPQQSVDNGGSMYGRSTPRVY